MPPLLRGEPPAYRHPPYQGGQGGSNLKSIFNLIITSYLEKMFSLSDLRETKVYQEALEEGREEGKEEGNTIFQKVCHTW